MSEVNPDYPIIGVVLHAPYFVFLRGMPLPTDGEVLELLFPPPRSWWRGLLGAPAHERVPVPVDLQLGEEYVYVGEQAGWYMIADDWYYHLWHRRDRKELLQRLAARWELFTLVRPDVDESYEFVHSVGGRRVRERRVESPHYTDRVVTIEHGRPLPCETDDLYGQDGEQIVWTVAAAVGVPRVHDRAALRRYRRL